jgi:hypothetical protein
MKNNILFPSHVNSKVLQAHREQTNDNKKKSAKDILEFDISKGIVWGGLGTVFLPSLVR